jgi:hypothetical protein
MASPFQQQSLQRKLIYIGLIFVLFTGSWVLRKGVVEAQANELSLREENLGAVELTGSAIRLSLTGSRGLAVAILWMNAMEKQKKNQWDELEMLVSSVTKLQPHFMTPWLFQSWNLSYNVAVKCDAISDQYFYIARGMELLADGERQNHNQPDLRFAMGEYAQQKICQGDRKITLQSLFQMSSIRPELRDPARFSREDRDGRRTIDLEAFKAFCEENPRLVRRLREQHKQDRPEDVVKFLGDNYRLPSLYKDRPQGGRAVAGTENPTELNEPEKRFPILPPPRTPPPPQHLFDRTELTWDATLGDDFDGYAAARAWFGYAQEPLPDPIPERPNDNKPIENRARQRLPKVTTILFRQRPARAQSYVAEFLEEEGWFDWEWQEQALAPTVVSAVGQVGGRTTPWQVGLLADALTKALRFKKDLELKHNPGWEIQDWFGKPVRVGDRLQARPAWEKAQVMWVEQGRKNGLHFDTAEQEADLRHQADEFVKRLGVQPGTGPRPLRPEEQQDPDLVAGEKAYRRLQAVEHYRTLTNYQFFYYESQAQQKPETVAARTALFDAQQAQKAGRATAGAKYEKFLDVWAGVLGANPEYAANNQVQEDSYDYQWSYLKDFMTTTPGKRLRQEMMVTSYLGQALIGPLPGSQWRSLAYLTRPPLAPRPLVEGPLDVARDDRGQPLISEDTKRAYRMKKGLIPTPETPAELRAQYMAQQGKGPSRGPGATPLLPPPPQAPPQP